MDNEIWKDIVGYEGKYQVSNLGRVKSLSKLVKCRGGFRSVKERILKQSCRINGNIGYLHVDLGRFNSQSVHRLVASTFIDNPNCFEQVNHIDGNKWNNRSDNLEWCTQSQNMKHAYKCGLQKIKLPPTIICRKITSISPNKEIQSWDKVVDCGRALGIRVTSIMRVIRGERTHCHGYKFILGEKYIKPK